MNTPEKDQWDEQAEVMLPCQWSVLGCDAEHHYACPAIKRSAVAAKLREMGAEITELKDEKERLTGELLRIGDRAVVNWDDATVGEVVRVGVVPTQTYIESRRAELAQSKAMREFVGDEMLRSDYKSVAEMRAEIEKLKVDNLTLKAENHQERRGSMSQLRYTVTVQFTVDATATDEIARRLEDLRQAGKIIETKAKAVGKHDQADD